MAALTIVMIAIVIGAASGAIGSFILLRRLSLVGDALSHVALPGIALALAYKVDPFWGVLDFLIPAAGVVWWLEDRTYLHPETVVGLLFTTSLAIGILTIPQLEIIESLFGGFPELPVGALVGISTVGIALIVAVFILAQRFGLAIVAADIVAPAVRRRSDLLLLLIFATIVSLGIKLVGTLLMGALTIIPAAIARNATSSLKHYMLGSTIVGALMTAIGALTAQHFHWMPGPVIVLLGAGLFAISLGVRSATSL